MTFPATQLDVHLYLFLDGQWLDQAAFFTIIDDVYTDVYVDTYLGRRVWDYNRLLAEDITVSHGRRDSQSRVDAAEVRFSLKNDDGLLTPDDPRGLGLQRGTGCKVVVEGHVIFWGEVSTAVVAFPAGDMSKDIDDTEILNLPAVADADRLGYCRVDIVANGILRRLNQGRKPLRSPLERLIVKPNNLVHVSDYWPMEDGTDAKSMASGIPASAGSLRPHMTTTGLKYASDSTLAGSEPLPTVESGGSGQWTAHLTGQSGGWVCEHFLHMPAAPSASSTSIRLNVTTDSVTHAKWTVTLGFDGTNNFLRVRSYNSAGATQVDTTVTGGIDGLYSETQVACVRLSVKPGGSGINWDLSWYLVGDHIGVVDDVRAAAGTHSGTQGTPNLFIGHVQNAPSGGVSPGHLIFHDGIAAGWLNPAERGWKGELALDRMLRLAVELGTPFTFTRRKRGETAPMGVQKALAAIDLYSECEAADGGILGEGRTQFCLHYLTRRARMNRVPALVLDARALSQISGPFEPTLDDQAIRNDVEVDRIDGSKFRRTFDESIQNEGLYDESRSLSLADDSQLRDQCGWWLHVGSWASKFYPKASGQGQRYPNLSIDLAKASAEVEALVGGLPALVGGLPVVFSSGTLIDGWTGINVGDRVQAVNLPPQHQIEGPVDQLFEGWSETVGPYKWEIQAQTSPAGPWQVATWGEGRWSPRRALVAAIDDSQTTFDVTATPTPWVTDSAKFPFPVRIGVETANVTAIGALSSGKQTFTVTRGLNRFPREHPAGAVVVLAEPAVEAL